MKKSRWAFDVDKLCLKGWKIVYVKRLPSGRKPVARQRGIAIVKEGYGNGYYVQFLSPTPLNGLLTHAVPWYCNKEDVRPLTKKERSVLQMMYEVKGPEGLSELPALLS